MQDVYVGLCEGLENAGVTVARFNLNDRIAFYAAAQLLRDGEMKHAFAFGDACQMGLRGVEAAAYELEALYGNVDAVVFVSGFFLDERLAETIKRHGTTVVIIHTEVPYEDDMQVDRAQFADINIVNDPVSIERFPKGTEYFPHSYRPTVHYPGVGTPEWDFCFVGTGFESRIEFFEKVDFGGLRVQFAGNWQQLSDDSPLQPFTTENTWCIENEDTADLYRMSLTSANFYRREHHEGESCEGWALGPREVELAACGTWFARDPHGEGDELFPMLPKFSTADELGEQIRWALNNPDARMEAAHQARAAIAERTYDTFALSLLYLIEQIRRP